MSVSRQVWRGTAFVSGASLLARVGTFAANLAIIRLLGKEAVGQLGLFESWLGLASMFALVGIGVGITKFVAQFHESDAPRVGGIAATSLLLGVGLSLGVSGLAWGVLALDVWRDNPVAQLLHLYFFWFVGLLVVSTLRQIVTSIIYGLQTFQTLVGANIAVGALSFPLAFFLVKSHHLEGALAARLGLALVETVWLFVAMFAALRRGGAQPHLKAWRRDGRELLMFGLPTFVGQLASNPVQPFVFSLLATQPGGVAQVGLITTAQRLVSLVSFFPSSMAATITPVLSSEWGSGDRSRFREGALTTLRMCWLCALPLTLLFMAACPGVLGRLYGESFVEAWPVTFLLLGVSLLTSLNETGDRSFIAAGRVWLSTSNNFVWLALFVPLAWWLLPLYGALGYAGGFVITFTLYVALQMWWLHRLFAVRVRALFGLLAASFLLVVLAWEIAWLRLGFLAPVLTAGCVAIETLWFLSQSERDAFSNRFKALRLVRRFLERGKA